MRGEHARHRLLWFMSVGSSPHARGAHRDTLNASIADGIIPACAGSTARSPQRSTLPWDHPRMRGEHYLRTQALGGGEGSSPHARGARLILSSRISNFRIIPACAGSTA